MPLAPGREHALTRDEIVAAAVRLVDARGAAAFTMRRLAEALGVTPMALYLHFDSKTAILRGVVEQVWDEALAGPGVRPDMPERGPDPVAVVVAMGRHIRATMRRHPGAAPLLVAEPVPSERMTGTMERIAAGLGAVGFEGGQVGPALYALATYTLGSALLTASFQHATKVLEHAPTARGGELADRLGAEDAGVRSAIGALAPPDDVLFEHGLRALVAGLGADAA